MLEGLKNARKKAGRQAQESCQMSMQYGHMRLFFTYWKVLFIIRFAYVNNKKHIL